MKVVSAAEMRRIDELAQSQYGLDAYDLMSDAGQAIAEHAVDAYQPADACVLCGKGNNAGDGFVVARTLYNMGRTVRVVCMEPETDYDGAARKAWDRLRQTNIEIRHARELENLLRTCDLVVDALLGTGIRGPARDEYADIIRQINDCGKPLVSVDVPSGLRDLKPDEEPGAIIRANLTLTVGLPKTMLLTLPGAEYAGNIKILPINFPEDLLGSEQWHLNWAPDAEVAQWLPPRKDDSNKGTFGNVGIIGSALSYAGATIMVARAALRAGCGLETIYTLPAGNTIYKTALPEATSIILESDAGAWFDKKSAEQFIENHQSLKVLAMGPGLGTAPETKQFVKMVLDTWDGPTVLDADALNLLSDGALDLLKGRKECLITPHPGEMARLTGKSVGEIQDNRVETAQNFAETYGVTVLLKGAGTVIARPDRQTWIIPGGEAALAKGGTGDVLTGAIAALYAQGMPVWQAAVAGATAHLHAGRRCAKKYGSRGVFATEVADEIPLVLDTLS